MVAFQVVLLLSAATVRVTALPASTVDGQQVFQHAPYLVETAPGEDHWVTEEGKLKLLQKGIHFFDITNESKDHSVEQHGVESISSQYSGVSLNIKYPVLSQQKSVSPLLDKLSADKMKESLEVFTRFHTRYYKSDTGKESSKWLLERINDMIEKAGARDVAFARHYGHSWPQSSIIATIPGQSNTTIVVGAHQDSINMYQPFVTRSPGADDDGSGTVTILEAFRILLQDKNIAAGQQNNTIEFHWYAAEEAGLLGSQDIFKAYAKNGRNVKAMLQQDMTGYIAKTIKAGKPESVAVVVDYVNANLTEFIKTIITEYCDIPFIETKCGYACSDHASAAKHGFPSAFVIESAFELSNDHIHTENDLIEYLSFEHMLQHARMTTAYAYELAFAEFS